MTPQEKATELVSSMNSRLKVKIDQNRFEEAKQCALKAVDEIIDFIDAEMQGFLDSDWINYWVDVKQEIEKL